MKRKATPADYPPPVGSILRTHMGNHNDEVLHVRGHIDGLLVLRVWFRHKQRWHYTVEGQIWFRHFWPVGTIEVKP